MYFPFYLDGTILLILPAILLAIYAQYKIKGTFKHFAQVPASRGFTGAQVARDILARQGLDDVRVEPVPGQLTDHYDPRHQVLRLSEPVYGGHSVAALGVAAHEAGHALQYAQAYVPVSIRNSLVPVANLGSQLGIPLAVIGFFFLGSELLLQIGIALFAAAVLFHVVTLPVEFNASRRALAQLTNGGYLVGNEVNGARKVLNAAALTYVATTLVAIMHLLRLLLLANRD